MYLCLMGLNVCTQRIFWSQITYSVVGYNIKSIIYYRPVLDFLMK